jgi:hypothetical protein
MVGRKMIKESRMDRSTLAYLCAKAPARPTILVSSCSVLSSSTGIFVFRLMYSFVDDIYKVSSSPVLSSYCSIKGILASYRCAVNAGTLGQREL